MISEVEASKPNQKPLGLYLLEAGLITPARLEMALNEQKVSGRRLEEVLVMGGWVEQQTIEYLIEKVVLPDRRALKQQVPDVDKNGRQNLTLVEQAGFTEREDSDSPTLLPIPARQLKFNLSASKAFQFLLLVVLSLTLANLIAQFSIYFLPDFPLRDLFVQLFNVEGELTIPALYSTCALLFCSIVLAIITYAKKVAGESYVRHWGALSIIFLYLSLDEVIALHEKTHAPVKSTLNTSGFLSFAWVIPAMILVLICLLAFLKFLTHLPPKTRRLFLIAGTIYVGGAIGMEMVGGQYSELYGGQNIMFAIIQSIEEFLEMLGIVIFIYALVSYISSYMKGMSLRINITDSKRQRQSA